MKKGVRNNNRGCYFPDPGTVESEFCGVCGEDMVVTRNAYGPTQWAMAVGGFKRLHDAFWCPHYQTDWHKRAVELVNEKNKTVSGKVRRLIDEEIKEILATKHLPDD